MRPAFASLALLLVAAAVARCGGDGGDGDPLATASTDVLSSSWTPTENGSSRSGPPVEAALRRNQNVPPLATSA